MPVQKPAIRLIATLAIFMSILFATGTQAAAADNVLHSFQGGTDGSYPPAGLTFDAAGNLYGTTAQGGTNNSGTVFELTPGAGGTYTEKVLHSFINTDGYLPQAGLVFDTAGNLYGTTIEGGTYLAGTVFELTPAGGGT